MNDWRVILQWAELTSGLGACRRFGHGASVGPLHLAIVAEPGRGQHADALFQEIERRIGTFSVGQVTANDCGGPRLLGCMGRYETTCRSVLVVLSSGTRVSSATEQLMLDWLQGTPQYKIVLPIIPATADPQIVLPPSLNHLIVLRDTGRTTDLVPDILRCAGIGSDEFRMFISYRRADAPDLADQLFDRFSHEGFDVFLDRFRGVPGRNFPPQLSEALIDKGLVVVIESANIAQSPWTIAEVQFANNYRLGLLSLQLPGGMRFGAIGSNDRYPAGHSDMARGGTGSLTLTTNALDNFANFVRERYAVQLLKRRVYLEMLLEVALRGVGISSSRHSNGIHKVTSGGRTPDYWVDLSTRHPQVSNVRRVVDAATSTSDQRVVVGPLGFQSPEAQSNFGWLVAQLNVAAISEVTATQLVRDIKNGRSLP